MRRLVLIEFNELCPSLLTRFIEQGKLPNFERLYSRSEVFVSEADAEPPALEPWIQWYSLHTGLPFERHKVFNLTDGPRAGHPDLWQVLLEEGLRVGNCGSMNAKGFSAPGSFFLPDPWCDSEDPHPRELSSFYRFVRMQVQEHARSDRALPLADYARFAGFLAGHGLRRETAMLVARQLLRERMGDGKATWRRAPLLDSMQFDVMQHYVRRLDPHFVSFFSNSTAHYQHSYWRQMDPSAFQEKPSEADVREYGDAILFGYQSMDRLLGRFFETFDDGSLLVFATALSQQPDTRWDGRGGQRFYRPSDIAALLARAGVAYANVQPVMTHQFVLHFGPGQDREEAMRRLKALEVAGKTVIDARFTDDAGLFFGSQIATLLPDGAMLRFPDGAEEPFSSHLYLIEGTKAGRHHPDGALWFGTGRHHRHEEKVSILDVFPTVLELFGLARGSRDRELPGSSLTRRFNTMPRLAA